LKNTAKKLLLNLERARFLAIWSIFNLKFIKIYSIKDALECLQDAGYSETEVLQPLCAQAVWDYKIDLTQVILHKL
jgi:hypothetical protein